MTDEEYAKLKDDNEKLVQELAGCRRTWHSVMDDRNRLWRQLHKMGVIPVTDVKLPKIRLRLPIGGHPGVFQEIVAEILERDTEESEKKK